MLRVPDAGLEEHRRRQAVVRRHGPKRDHRLVHHRVVEPGQRSEHRDLRLSPRGVLEREAQGLRRLVVELHDGLVGRNALIRPRDLEVVTLPGRNVGQVRHRVLIEDVQADLIQAIGGNLAEHAAVGVARGAIGIAAGAGDPVVANERPRVAVVVRRRREVALPLGCGREAVTNHVVALLARLELLGEEEEQLVLAAWLAHRTAHREAPVALLQRRLRIVVEEVGLGVRVPVRVALDVVDRSAEAIGAAAGDGRHLQAARPAELGLVARREHLHLRNRLGVDRDHQSVAARFHRADAVHHEVVRAAAGRVGITGPVPVVDARHEVDELGEISRRHRKIGHGIGFDRKRPLAGGCLYQRRFAAHVNHLGGPAHFEGERAKRGSRSGTERQP